MSGSRPSRSWRSGWKLCAPSHVVEQRFELVLHAPPFALFERRDRRWDQ